jgi:hypothetical protein
MCADKHTVAGQSFWSVRAWAELIGMWRGIFVRLGLGQSAPDLRCTWQGADQHWRSNQKTIPDDDANLVLLVVLVLVHQGFSYGSGFSAGTLSHY